MHLVGGQRGVLQVGGAAVGEADAAAGRNPPRREIQRSQPAGVVVDATAEQLCEDRRHLHQVQTSHT